MTKAETRAFPIWRIVVGGFIVVGFCSILCWYFGWCWWCRPCPEVDCCDEVDAAAEIILEDMHAGVWMPMDNSAFHFDDPNDPDDDGHPSPASVCSDANKAAFGPCENNYEVGPVYRHGVLFQTGPVVEFSPQNGYVAETRYGGVYIEYAGGSEWLLPKVIIDDEEYPAENDFDWLDVIEAGTKCVMDPEHAYEMVHILDDASSTGSHLQNHGTPATTDLATNQCDASSVTTEQDLACKRNRSIHASLLPSRIITYWPAGGGGSFGMVTGPTTEIPIKRGNGSSVPTHSADSASHVSYTFRLPQTVVVDRFKNGCHEKRYTGVTLIRILYHNSSVFHLGYPHRPMDGR